MKNIILIFVVSLALIMNPAIAATRKQIEKVRKQQDDASLQSVELLVKRRLLSDEEFEINYSNGATFKIAWERLDREIGPWWEALDAVPLGESFSDEDVDTAIREDNALLVAQLEARFALLRDKS